MLKYLKADAEWEIWIKNGQNKLRRKKSYSPRGIHVSFFRGKTEIPLPSPYTSLSKNYTICVSAHIRNMLTIESSFSGISSRTVAFFFFTSMSKCCTVLQIEIALE